MLTIIRDAMVCSEACPILEIEHDSAFDTRLQDAVLVDLAVDDLRA